MENGANCFPERVLLALAQNLQKPACADVEFDFPSDKEGRKLYAMKIVIEARSSYFSRSVL